MIQTFVDRFMAAKPALAAKFAAAHPEDYTAIVRAVIEVVAAGEEWDWNAPDPERIHLIDDGDYQGTLVFVIGAKGYQPSTYWYVKVGYGSCSGCDTLESIRNYDSGAPSDSQVSEYMTLALHVVQGLKQMGEDSA